MPLMRNFFFPSPKYNSYKWNAPSVFISLMGTLAEFWNIFTEIKQLTYSKSISLQDPPGESTTRSFILFSLSSFHQRQRMPQVKAGSKTPSIYPRREADFLLPKSRSLIPSSPSWLPLAFRPRCPPTPCTYPCNALWEGWLHPGNTSWARATPSEGGKLFNQEDMPKIFRRQLNCMSGERCWSWAQQSCTEWVRLNWFVQFRTGNSLAAPLRLGKLLLSHI